MKTLVRLFRRFIEEPLQAAHERSIKRPINPATTAVESAIFERLPDLANIVFGACIALSAVSVDALSRELRFSEGTVSTTFVVMMYVLRIILGVTIWILYFRMIALAKDRARVLTEWFSTLAWAPLPFAVAFFAAFAGVPLFGGQPSELGLALSTMSIQWIAFASLSAFHAFLALFGYAMLAFGDASEAVRVEIRANSTFMLFGSLSWAFFSIGVAVTEHMIRSPWLSLSAEFTITSVFGAITLGFFVLGVVRSAAVRRAYNNTLLAQNASLPARCAAERIEPPSPTSHTSRLRKRFDGFRAAP